MKKKETWHWQEAQEKAFLKLKADVIQNIKGFFKPGAETKLFTDASKVVLGAVLVQRQEKRKRSSDIRRRSAKP